MMSILNWMSPTDAMPPMHKQVLVALRGGVGGSGEVCDVACYIGKQDDGSGKAVDRWILADVRLETRQIAYWAEFQTPAALLKESADG